ncbi:MAG: ABC transporter permease [Christensenellaceae bacterium]|nr:ABC transporter permease [Christensenellaceae bacterium]MEA5067306.1 ABC transporter permease [Eubacteriales bacterium]MEA5069137.1 ABC transporter permease [Christensenellaceae bacterium]
MIDRHAQTLTRNAGMTRKQFISMFGSLIALVLLIALMSILKSNFLSGTNIRNILRIASINGLLAVGMTFVILTGGIDLSVGAIMGCAGMFSAYFAQNSMGYPWYAGVLVGMGMGLVIGLFNGVSISYLKVPAFVGTLGAMSIAKGMTFLLTSAKPIPSLNATFKMIGGGEIGGWLPIPIVIMGAVLLICFILLYKTRYGRYVFAVGGNLNAAHASGIDTRKITCSVYMISGILAALAGIITTARVTSGVTSTGDGYETNAIAMVVIGGTSLAGGRGRLWGTIVGILLLQCLTTGLDMLAVNAYYQLIIKGFVVIGAVMLDGLSADL